MIKASICRAHTLCSQKQYQLKSSWCVCLHIRICKCWSQFKHIYMSNFQPLEVVVRGSETQLQVGGNLNYLIYRSSQIHFKPKSSWCVCLHIRICKCWPQFKQIYMSNFQPLEVVARGSATQLQVGGNLNYLIYRREQIHFKQMSSWCVCLDIRTCKYWSQFKQIYMSNFQPLEVVVRGSETQVQVGGNLNYLIYHCKGWISCNLI